MLIDWLVGYKVACLWGGGYGLDEIIEMDGLNTTTVVFFQNHWGDFYDDALVSAGKKAHFGMGIAMKGSTPSR